MFYRPFDRSMGLRISDEFLKHILSKVTIIEMEIRSKQDLIIAHFRF